jgi:flavodoxin
MRTLVAYYSLTGNTAKIAQAIAARLGADLEPIRAVKPRSPWSAMLDTILNATPAIAAGAKSVADYDLVILGGPVWGMNPSSPVRAFIKREREHFKRLALFCTLGGGGGEAALRKTAHLCGQSPIATLFVEQPDFQAGRAEAKVDAFAREIRALGDQAAA